MYSALDVARYVINYSNKKGNDITNLKLQKILYYIQAGFLIETGERCFSDPILSWQHGPVVRNVYNVYRKNTSLPIPEQTVYDAIDVKDGRLVSVKKVFSEEEYQEEDRELFNRIIDGLAGLDAWRLVEKTHEEDPWKQVKNYNEEITTESIREFFSSPEHRGRIYGKFD